MFKRNSKIKHFKSRRCEDYIFHLQIKIAAAQIGRCSNLYLSQSCIFTILPSLQLMILGL